VKTFLGGTLRAGTGASTDLTPGGGAPGAQNGPSLGGKGVSARIRQGGGCVGVPAGDSKTLCTRLFWAGAFLGGVPGA